VAGESSYVEHAPTPAFAAFIWSVWIQQVGDRPLAQRYEPHGGAEVRCLLGEAPRLLGPLTASRDRRRPRRAGVLGRAGRRGRDGRRSGVLGEGVRFFGSHAGTVLLADPDHAFQGDRVLHLRYTVVR
jgi:hypothetical protein